MRLRAATPITVLLTVALLFLVLAVVSPPFTKQFALAQVGGYSFGVLGYCDNSGRCSHAQLGYDIDKLLAGNSSLKFKLPSTLRNGFSKILILHIVAAAFNMVLILLTLISHFGFAGNSVSYLLVVFLFMFPTLIFTLAAFVTDIIVFAPYYETCTWLVLVAAVFILISGVLTCLTRRTLKARKSMRRRVADNPEMSGSSFFAQQRMAKQSFVSSFDKEFIPQYTEFEVEKNDDHSGSNPSQSSSIRNYTKGGFREPEDKPYFAAAPSGLSHHPSYDNRGLQHHSDIIPLDENGPDNYQKDAFLSRRQQYGHISPPVRHNLPVLNPPNSELPPWNDNPDNSSRNVSLRSGTTGFNRQTPRKAGFRNVPSLDGGISMASVKAYNTLGEFDDAPKMPPPRMPTASQPGGPSRSQGSSPESNRQYSPIDGQKGPVMMPMRGGPMRKPSGPRETPANDFYPSMTDDPVQPSRKYETASLGSVGPIEMPQYDNRIHSRPAGPNMSQVSYNGPYNYNSRPFAGSTDSFEEVRNPPHSPSASTSSHFTSISQRGVNPQWNPTDSMENISQHQMMGRPSPRYSVGPSPMMSMVPMASGGPRLMSTNHSAAMDTLSSNPDFQLPSFATRGRGRGRGRSLARGRGRGQGMSQQMMHRALMNGQVPGMAGGMPR